MGLYLEVLSDGYSRWLDGQGQGQGQGQGRRMSANGSCSLIKTEGLRILVDTLGPWDGQRLTHLLAAKGLHPTDITHLVCTHCHPDHVGNLNLFTEALHIVGHSIYKKDVYQMDLFSETRPYPLAANATVIATPGHTLDSISLVVENVVNMGTVVVAGDLFENEADLRDEAIWREAGSEDPEKQTLSRNRILGLASYIVPGHGPIFPVPSKAQRPEGNLFDPIVEQFVN